MKRTLKTYIILAIRIFWTRDRRGSKLISKSSALTTSRSTNSLSVLIFLFPLFQSKEARMAKRLCIHKGNGRDAFGALERKSAACHHPSDHCNQYFQRTLPRLGWRYQVDVQNYPLNFSIHPVRAGRVASNILWCDQVLRPRELVKQNRSIP